MRILSLLGLSTQEEQDLGALEADLKQLLGDAPADVVRHATGLSGLLAKIAYSDGDISEDEESEMRRILNERLTLDTDIVSAIVSLASGHVVELAGIEDYTYSRMIVACLPEKAARLKVLEALFLVASIDGDITFEEDKVIGHVATALKLTRQDFIQSRLPFSEHLSVIKNLPKV